MSEVKPEKPETKLEFEEDDAGEDPNELLTVDPALVDSSVWLIKVPKGLMEKWSNVKENDIPLANLRIYNAPEGEAPRITISLPENPQYDAGTEPKEWELATESSSVHSQYILSDQRKPNTTNKRARTTAIKGKVTTRGKMMRTQLTADYGAKMKQRTEAVKPKRHVKIITDTLMGQTGGNLKMLQSGAMQSNAGFNTASARPTNFSSSSGSLPSSSKPPPFERSTRIARNILLDTLFSLFSPQTPYWSLKDLRKRTNQPEAYLKEILGEIADFHRSGPNTNSFSLKEGFKGMAGGGGDVGGSGEGVSAANGNAGMEAKMEEEEDEDDSDDEDMEEIS